MLLFPPLKSTVQLICTHTILIIRPGGIGDAILLLPMLHRLSSIYPDAKLDILAERRNAEVFLWSPVVSRIWQYDRPLDFLKLFQQNYDLIIDTEQWYRLSAVVARLLRSSRLIGFATNERSRLFSDPCPYKQDEYEADMFMSLLAPLGCTSPFSVDSSVFLTLPQADHVFENPYIVIFPGSSISAKQWPAERFAEVARFCEERGFDVVLLGGKADRDVSDCISKELSRCHNLVGKTDLTEAAAIISDAGMMISGDSGLLHVAQSQGIPTVSLFGPSNPLKWNRSSSFNVILKRDIACSPCSRFGIISKCKYGFRCMQEINVAEVLKAVEFLLNRNS